MALDEYLFGKVAAFFKRRRRADAGIVQRTVLLTDVAPRLTLIASALNGCKIEIYPAEAEGGYKDESFFLPSSFFLFPSAEANYSFYLYRTFFLSVQRSLGFNHAAGTDVGLDVSRQEAARTAPQVLGVLFSMYPAIEELHSAFHTYLQQRGATTGKPAELHWLYGKWMRNDGHNSGADLMHGGGSTPTPKEKVVPTTVLKAGAVEETITLQVDKKQQEDYVLTHNFEKVETADEFNGTWRDFDGDDQLEDHSAALDELTMKYTVRVDDQAHSVYQADFAENTTIAESAETTEAGICYEYPEWDHSKQAYRQNFCKVYPVHQLQTDSKWTKDTLAAHTGVLTLLRKSLASIHNKWQQQRRQQQGAEFDIDAVTDLMVDKHSGTTPSDKIYLSEKKAEKDLSILLLLDISLSADGYADGNRVIDVEKQVSLLFGEVLNEYGVDFAIAGFCSHTRNNSTFLHIKSFDEAWSTARHRVGAVQPRGYTRIGAAIRHAGALLSGRQTAAKWVILISDGKPNDYDKYEGRYGINDVRQALRELHVQHIGTYALAIEAQAKYYLPRMFGTDHYQILTSPSGLLLSMGALFDRIRRSAFT